MLTDRDSRCSSWMRNRGYVQLRACQLPFVRKTRLLCRPGHSASVLSQTSTSNGGQTETMVLGSVIKCISGCRDGSVSPVDGPSAVPSGAPHGKQRHELNSSRLTSRYPSTTYNDAKVKPPPRQSNKIGLTVSPVNQPRPHPQSQHQ
jgi:hypothetical protein